MLIICTVIFTKDKEEEKRPYSDISSVASATECTGLTQFVPDCEAETESFKSVYDIPLGDKRKNNKSPRKKQ